MLPGTAGEDPHEEAGWEDLQAFLKGCPIQMPLRLNEAIRSGLIDAEHWERPTSGTTGSAHPEGIEPSTYGLEIRCSIH